MIIFWIRHNELCRAADTDAAAEVLSRDGLWYRWRFDSIGDAQEIGQGDAQVFADEFMGKSVDLFERSVPYPSNDVADWGDKDVASAVGANTKFVINGEVFDPLNAPPIGDDDAAQMKAGLKRRARERAQRS